MNSLVPLMQVAEVIRGVTFPRDAQLSEGDAAERRAPAAQYVPVVRAGHIQQELNTTDDLIYIPRSFVSADQMVRQGDIIMSGSSGTAANVGKSARAPSDWDGTVGGFCYIVRPREPQYGRLLAHYLQGETFRRWRLQSLVGATIQNLRKGDVEAMEVPWLSGSRLSRALEILDLGEAITTKARARVRLVSELNDRVFAEAFGDLAKYRRVSFEELLAETKLGLVRSASELTTDPEATPYLRMDAIQSDGSLNVTNQKRVQVSSREKAEFELREGDLLFNTRNSRPLVGKTAVFPLVRETFVFNNNIMRIRLRREASPYFVSGFFRSPEGHAQLERIKSGTTSVVAIYFKDLRRLSIPLPDPQLQRAYDEAIKTNGELLDMSARLQREADNLRSAVSALVFEDDKLADRLSA